MVDDYQRLWRGVTSASNETQAVRTLAEILIDKEGRDFVSRLKRKDAELCIEVLDRVSCHPHRLSSFVLLGGFARGLRGTSSKPPRNSVSSLH